eukprot:114363-Amphidinium_carterae.1
MFGNPQKDRVWGEKGEKLCKNSKESKPYVPYPYVWENRSHRPAATPQALSRALPQLLLRLGPLPWFCCLQLLR